MEKILLLVLVSSEIFILSSCLLVRQYYYVDQQLNWTEAQTYCRQKHTDLATIENSEEMDQVMKTVSSAGNSSYFWIGLYSHINWIWSDGFTGFFYNYNYWSSQDSFHSRGDQICMGLYRYNSSTYDYLRWTDENCSSLLPFVCYNGTQQNPEYVFVNESMNWSSAQRYCRQNFTDLATVRNSTDWTNIQNAMPYNQNSWIGLYRDSNISWSDGSSFFFYQQPFYFYHCPGMKSARCGCQHVNSTNDWYFYTCENRYPFVCYGPKAKIQKHVVKLRLKTENSDVLNDAAVKAKLLEKLQEKLEENGVSGVKVKWRQTIDGEVFKKEEKTKTEL